MSLRPAYLHRGQFLYEGRLCCFCGQNRFWEREPAGAPITLASSADVISSSNESRACDISGFIEDRVMVMSSVPYRCMTSFGSAGLINLSQVNTIMFSSEGYNSSSTVITSPWCKIWLSRCKRLSSTKATSRWYRSSGRSSRCRWMSAKSMKCEPVDWKP